MLSMKKTSIAIVASTFALALAGSFVSLSSNAHEQSKAQNDIHTLKSVMRGLLKDTQLITKGIVLSDFSTIEQAAKRVADHPTPGMKTKMKLAANLGSEMMDFKAFDTTVHDGAVNIAKAAKEKNMNLVVSEYKQLIDGCIACHGTFKERVTEILK